MKKLNQEIIIRPPKLSDAKSLVEMMNSLIDEKAMISVQKKVTLEDEKEYLKEILKDKNSIHLFLLINGEVMGSASISRHSDIRSHIGEMGIIIKKEARGLGLGKKIFKEVMEKGIKELKLKIVSLTVFESNKIAQNLYKKLGFEKLGTVKKGVKYYEKYEDSIIMVKYLD
jgi:RimJ/RimL family protein N-acetyltransferase